MSTDERELSMLSKEEKDEISDEFHRYERKSAVCIEALRIVQRHRGWVSNEAVLDIASFLDMSPADVDGVATFYNLIFRKPVGRNVIFVCDSVSCWVMGCNAVKKHLRTRLGIEPGQTSLDGAFTVLPIACLGHCESAPALLIHDQEQSEPITHVTEQAVDELIARCRQRDRERRSV
jgi:NADH-quinone oxidoreductase subunit E